MIYKLSYYESVEFLKTQEYPNYITVFGKKNFKAIDIWDFINNGKSCKFIFRGKEVWLDIKE